MNTDERMLQVFTEMLSVLREVKSELVELKKQQEATIHAMEHFGLEFKTELRVLSVQQHATAHAVDRLCDAVLGTAKQAAAAHSQPSSEHNPRIPRLEDALKLATLHR